MSTKTPKAEAAAAPADPAAARNRSTTAEDGMPYPALGAMVVYTVPNGANPDLYSNGVRAGDRLPAVICRVLPLTPESDTRVNLRVFADADGDSAGETGGVVHVQNVARGPGQGKYQPLQATVHR